MIRISGLEKEVMNIYKNFILKKYIIVFLFFISFFLYSENQDQKNRSSNYNKFKIDFNIESLKEVILRPEKIMKNISVFWKDDPAYSLAKKWHNYERLPIDLDKWESKLKKYSSMSLNKRNKNEFLILAYKIIDQKKKFKRIAIPYLQTFLPESTPEIHTTVFFIEETRTGGFIENDQVVIDITRQSDNGIEPALNTLIHELFHVGYAKNRFRRSEYSLSNMRLLRMVDLLQNEGIATYVGYKIKDVFSDRGMKESYKKLKKPEIINKLITALNHLLSKAESLNNKDFYKLQGKIGYDQNAYYIVGAYMAKEIDEKLGRAALVKTVAVGPRSFISTYNSIAGKDKAVYEFPPPYPITLSMKLKKAYLEKNVPKMKGLQNKLKKNRDKIKKSEEQVLNMLGYLMIMNNELNKAINILKLNVYLFPKSANVYDSLGDAYYRAGEYKEALFNLKESLRLNPKNQHAVELITQIKGKLK